MEKGGVARHEMYRTFNCGVGMIAVVAKEDTERTIASLKASGENAWHLGEIVPVGADGARVTIG